MGITLSGIEEVKKPYRKWVRIVTFIVPSEWPENILSLKQTTERTSPFSLQST